ncbi:hypothetical protein D9758_000089 [Tetrapyrgos nigripes]|uniref:Acyl-protein thioesterase 1 n=1 Tax=Tetrapyrgos nigripes TaxID=182062 RepID=A0A8H5LZH9_9AGAR|nr:hypothetical protein D9758_000089 [Tetrapyrgos nigripes]
MSSTDIIPATQVHDATVIFIHGLGQSSSTWRADVIEPLAPSFPNVEWILPNAPKRPVTRNNGIERPSWFDIAHLPPHEDEFDQSAIRESISSVNQMIDAVVTAGLDSRRIILIGFSQGAALSLMASLSTPCSLGGVASLSGWIPHRFRQYLENQSEDRLPARILWCHGNADEDIPLSHGLDGVSFLKTSMKYSEPEKLQVNVYENLSHTINEEEIADLGDWLRKVLFNL